MPDESPQNPQAAPQVTELIEQWMLHDERGESISIEQLCKHAPHLVSEVRDGIDAIRQMDGLLETRIEGKTPSEQTSSSEAAPSSREGSANVSSSFELLELHAVGGSSEVYLARDDQLGRTVAIKFLRPDVAENKRLAARLLREAKITSRLDHPGVVSIHATGKDDQGHPFYTMRFVEGQSFWQSIVDFHSPETRHTVDKSETPKQFRKLLNHFVDICQTVGYAHDRQVVHRDLKPENIVIGNFGESYVIDWGLARALGEPTSDPADSSNESDSDDPRLTRVGTIFGTPAYMSPEQASGARQIGVPSDIFNLGAILFTLLTGHPPFRGKNISDVVAQAKSASLDWTRSGKPIAKPLRSICEKAMAARPEGRYQSALELAQEVENYLADEPVKAYRDPFAERVRRWVLKRRTMVSTVVVSGAVALLLLSIGIVLLLDANRNLAKRKAESDFHKGEATKALADATENLYGNLISLAHSELMQNNIVRSKQLLLECPVERRQWEWHHLYWLVTRHEPLQTFAIDGTGVFDVAVSSAETMIAAASGTRLLVWNTDGRSLHDIEWKMRVRSIEFFDDDKKLLLVGTTEREGRQRGTIISWDLATGRRINSRYGHYSTVTACLVSKDRQTIVTGGIGGQLRIRDAKSLEPKVRIKGHRSPVRFLRYDPNDSRFILSCDNRGFLTKWAVDDGKEIWSLQAHQGSMLGFDINRDHLVSCGQDKLIRVWKMEPSENGSVLNPNPQILVGHTDQVEKVAFSADGRQVVSVGLDRNIRIWDIDSGDTINVVRRHTSHIRAVKMGTQGSVLVTAGDDRKIHVWQTKQLRSERPRGRWVEFFGNEKRLAAAAENSLTLWDLETNRPIAELTGHPEKIADLEFDPGQLLLATAYRDGSAKIWSAIDGTEKTHLVGRQSPAHCCAFLDSGKKLAVGFEDRYVDIWDLQQQKVVNSFQTRRFPFRMAFDSQSNRLIVGQIDGSLSFWQADTGELSDTIRGHEGYLLDLAIDSERSRFATTGMDGKIKIWNIHEGKQLLEMNVGASWLNCLQFSPDGSRLVTGSEHTITFWNPENGKEVVSMSIERCIHSMSFSSDGQYLGVAGEDPFVRIWQGKSESK